MRPRYEVEAAVERSSASYVISYWSRPGWTRQYYALALVQDCDFWKVGEGDGSPRQPDLALFNLAGVQPGWAKVESGLKEVYEFMVEDKDKTVVADKFPSPPNTRLAGKAGRRETVKLSVWWDTIGEQYHPSKISRKEMAEVWNWFHPNEKIEWKSDSRHVADGFGAAEYREACDRGASDEEKARALGLIL